MSEVFWSVDYLVIKENAIFGFGWIFHEKLEINALCLRLTFVGMDNPATEIAIDTGKTREDVQRAFTNQPKALNSGYLVYGAFPKGALLRSMHLLCTLDDESVIELVIPKTSVFGSSSDNTEEINRLSYRQFYIFLKKGFHLIRSRHFKSLFEQIKKHLLSRQKTALRHPKDLLSILEPDERKNLCVIIDHDLGGGANYYRDRLVGSIIQEGRSVIILTFNVNTISHVFILRNHRIDKRYLIPDETFLLAAIKLLSVNEIIYNNAVSFVRPEEIPDLLINLKQMTSAQLKLLIHDFFIACPSHFLIDNSGKYCDIPDMNVCSSCIQRNQYGFTTLFVDRDLIKWRSKWGAVITVADEIITFSNSSSTLLRKAYPKISSSKISVIPHKINYLVGKTPHISNTNKLCIGVVGAIGFHKGSNFIKALAQEINHRQIHLKIVVIGSSQATDETSIISQTGSYLHDELPGLIEKTGVNVMLFPSIWPETFSYVVQELIEMNLPVATFNFGAPAERLALYPKGLILDSMDPRIVLDDLIAFHRKTYITN